MNDYTFRKMNGKQIKVTMIDGDTYKGRLTKINGDNTIILENKDRNYRVLINGEFIQSVIQIE